MNAATVDDTRKRKAIAEAIGTVVPLDMITCPICMELLDDDFVLPKCAHRVCTGCWEKSGARKCSVCRMVDRNPQKDGVVRAILAAYTRTTPCGVRTYGAEAYAAHSCTDCLAKVVAEKVEENAVLTKALVDRDGRIEEMRAEMEVLRENARPRERQVRVVRTTNGWTTRRVPWTDAPVIPASARVEHIRAVTMSGDQESDSDQISETYE